MKASLIADAAYGRDTSGHIVAIYTAPDGKTVDDPAFKKKILDNLAQVEKDHPDQVLRSIGYFKNPDLLSNMADADKKHAFMSIQLKGNDDDTILNNYKKVENDFFIKGVNVKLAGLQPLAAELTGTIGEDQQRAEVAAIPLVAVLLFFVFGGVVAASLPAIIGGLSIMGALGIMRLIADRRTGALLRPAGGDADRPGYCDRLRPVHRQPVPRGNRRGLRHRDGRPAHRDDVRPHGDLLGRHHRGIVAAAAAVPAGLPQVHHLRDHRLGHALGDPVDHRAGGRAGHPGPQRRRARRAHAAAGAVPAQLVGIARRSSNGSRRRPRRPRPAKRSSRGSGASSSTG